MLPASPSVHYGDPDSSRGPVDGLVSQVCRKTSQEGLTCSPAGEEGRAAGARVMGDPSSPESRQQPERLDASAGLLAWACLLGGAASSSPLRSPTSPHCGPLT